MNTAEDCLQQGFNFIPLVGEPSGGWGPSAQCFFKQLAKSLAGQSGIEAAVALKQHRQLIGVFLRRSNARAIFSRDPGRCILAPDTALSALADTDITSDIGM